MNELTNIEYIAFEDENGHEVEMQIVDEFEHDDIAYIALCQIPNEAVTAGDDEQVQFFTVTIDADGEEEFEAVEEKKILATLAEILEERLMKR